ncbi:MAG TPA: hypothetical protein VJ350_08900 [Methanoregula sp.]|nr:hypothetical protein [Methanoregula sp.]
MATVIPGRTTKGYLVGYQRVRTDTRQPGSNPGKKSANDPAVRMAVHVEK